MSKIINHHFLLLMLLFLTPQWLLADQNKSTPDAVVEIISAAEENSQSKNPCHKKDFLQKKVEPVTTPIERFVNPLTRWLEEQIHQKRSVKEPRNTPAATSLTLRTAINMAQQTHPGKVLSAEKVKSEELLSYRIKIISDKGIVKTILIDHAKEKNRK